jgi:hypothetical protein
MIPKRKQYLAVSMSRSDEDYNEERGMEDARLWSCYSQNNPYEKQIRSTGRSFCKNIRLNEVIYKNKQAKEATALRY